jgi:hypothetical protein
MLAFIYGMLLKAHDEPDTRGPKYEVIIAEHNGGFFTDDSVDSLVTEIEKRLFISKGRKAIAVQRYEEIE